MKRHADGIIPLAGRCLGLLTRYALLLAALRAIGDAGRPLAAHASLTALDLGIKGRSALVFGGSRGIGRAVAGTLAAEGANVAVLRPQGMGGTKGSRPRPQKGAASRPWGYPLGRLGRTVGRGPHEPRHRRFRRHRYPCSASPGVRCGTTGPRCPGEPGSTTASCASRPQRKRSCPACSAGCGAACSVMVPWPTPGTAAERHFDSVTSAALPAWLQSVAAGRWPGKT